LFISRFLVVPSDLLLQTRSVFAFVLFSGVISNQPRCFLGDWIVGSIAGSARIESPDKRDRKSYETDTPEKFPTEIG
jgi:hypothetical protein